MPTVTARKRYKPKGLVLCSGCSKMVEAVCYGQCPNCFRKYDDALVVDLQSKDPKFKGFQDEKFHLNQQIEGLLKAIKGWEKKLRSLVVAKGDRKQLARNLEKMILQMGGR